MTFESDGDGNLIPDYDALYLNTIFDDTMYFGLFALYQGQILFRLTVKGKLEYNSFCAESFFTVKQAGKQVIYTAAVSGLCYLAWWNKLN